MGVLETGRRWTDQDFAEAGSRDALWAPRLGMFGPMRMSLLGEISLFSAVGVGGGSLIYANTLYEPHDAFFDDPSWSGITDWRAELRRTTTRPGGCSGSPRTRGSGRLTSCSARWRPTSARVTRSGPPTSGCSSTRTSPGGRPRPVLRRRRARAERLRALRPMHDRVPVQREEHAAQELPPPRRGGRRRGARADRGGRRPATDGWWLRTRRAAPGQAIGAAANVPRRPGRVRGRRAWHPAAAAPAPGGRLTPADLGPVSASAPGRTRRRSSPRSQRHRRGSTAASRSPRRSTRKPRPTSSSATAAQPRTRWP